MMHGKGGALREATTSNEKLLEFSLSQTGSRPISSALRDAVAGICP